MEKLAHCPVHRKRPAEYVCLACDNLVLCEACKQEHVIETGHTPENCKEIGLAIMHQQRIQCVDGILVKELIKGLRNGLKELEARVLQEIDRFQESCVQTKELRNMIKLDSDGRHAELYFYAKGLPMGGANNKAAMGKLKKRLLETIDKASDELMNVLNKTAAAKQYEPIFSAYKKDEVFMFKNETCGGEERLLSALHSTDMSKFTKAVYIDSVSAIGDSVASELASRLQTHSISALYLTGIQISEADTEALAQAALCNKSLSAFCIEDCAVSDIIVEAVAEAARNCRSLTALYLNGLSISSSGAKTVAEVMKSCPLSVFYLSGNNISDSGATAVAEAVKDCPLSAFCLSGGGISDAGAISVANAVKDCPLSVFYLMGFKISNAGTTAVAETLSSGECASTLSAFYLWSDAVSNSGAKKVADAIRGCTKLSAFYLDGGWISGETLEYILECMTGISTIQSVNLHLGEISKEQMDFCLHRLQQSGVARQLKLRFDCCALAANSVCKKFEAEWNAKFAELRIVSNIHELFMHEVILGIPK